MPERLLSKDEVLPGSYRSFRTSVNSTRRFPDAGELPGRG